MGKRRRRAEDLTEQELDTLAVAGDLEWWEATGECGGCASPHCHRGKACTGPKCRRCPSRDTPDTPPED